MKKYIVDSRSLNNPENTIFVALRTATGDGHDYIQDLYHKGVREFIVENGTSDILNKSCPLAIFKEVAEPLKFIQDMAAKTVAEFSNKIVAITGSRGKTIVKEWLSTLMSNNIYRSPRSYNSQIGVPLSILNLQIEQEWPLVIETGISKKGEMQVLNDILKPDIVVFTNITDEHREGFASQSEHIDEKLILSKNAETIVLHSDEKDLYETLQQTGQLNNKKLYLTKITDGKLTITLQKDNRNDTFVFPLDKLNECHIGNKEEDYINLALALTTAFILTPADFFKNSILKNIINLFPIRTRLTTLEGINGCTLFIDNFKCDIESLEQVFDIARRARKSCKHKFFIIYSNSQQTEDSDITQYMKIAGLASSYGFDKTIVYGDSPNLDYKNLKSFDNIENLVREFSPLNYPESVFLFHTPLWNSEFKELISHYEVYLNETSLEINLDALVHNYKYFKSKLYPQTGIICMLKAFGYGTGSVEIARQLEAQGVAKLAVAVTDEGIELRQKGIKTPIIILNPRSLHIESLLNFNLEPVIYNFEILTAILEYLKNQKHNPLKVHIKLDTGMHRLGFIESEIQLLAKILKEHQSLIKVDTVFSHLATADCLDMDSYTMNQLKEFEEMSSKLDRFIGYPIKRHILNTAGIERFPQFQYDFVRLGIGLYGIRTLPENMEKALENVASLYTRIIAIREWEAGTTIGYGRKGLLKRKSKIATIPLGYADGIDRHLGNGRGHMIVNGMRCPIVGNVCMDICMIDITDVPDCKVGTRVEVFGNTMPIEATASLLNTIPYEILTSVSKRVNRVYYRD